MKIKVTLQDGTIREVLQGTTIKEAAGAISTSLKKNAVAGKIDGKSVDLNQAIEHDCRLDIVTLDSKDGLEVYRHSTAHIMAQAIKRIYGDKAVQLGIGPVIEDGFYYDIDIEKPLSTDDLAAIEQEMAKIIQENHQIVRRVVSRAEAIKLLKS